VNPQKIVVLGHAAALGQAECHAGHGLCQNAAFPKSWRCCVPDASEGLVKSVESLIAEKEAVAAKEKKLIADLNTALGRMGYKVVATKPASNGAGSGAKRGRPPGSGKAAGS
jgi:hypothetical protein